MSANVSILIASIASWYTPTVLFCAANLIIATIFFASNKTKNNNNKQQNQNHLHNESHSQYQQQQQYQQQYSSKKSFLSRLTPIKTSSNPSITNMITSDTSPQQYSPSGKYSSTSRLAQSIHFFTDDESASSDPDRQPQSQPESTHSHDSTRSTRQLVHVQTAPPTVFDRVKTLRVSYKEADKQMVIKKSLSELRIESSDEEEDVDFRRPATAREKRNDAFDARADDFISRFKQQLNLQRMESLVRFKEMLNRGR